MRRIGILVLLAASGGTARAAEPFRQTVTNTGRNINAPAFEISSRKPYPLTPGCPYSWSIRKRTLHGGRQEGVELIEVDNGKLLLIIIPTRGMGILSVAMDDLRLGWDSPVHGVVHPQFVNLQSRGGLGWLDGFSEWLCRCGLESNGHPGTDRFINHVGEEATMELTLHGKIANLPAQDVEVVIDREAPFRLHVRGRVAERMFHGPKLELVTDISTEAGSRSFRITDVISNQGSQPQEFQILYHINFGPPLLEKGSTFLAPVERVTPFNDHAAKCVRDYRDYAGPEPGFVEQVYCVRLSGDSHGRSLAVLQNRAKDRAVSMAFSLKALPYFTLWKNTAAEQDGYVTGLEPGTNFPNTRRIERQFGRVPRLAPGASHRTVLDFALHVGLEEVQAIAERVAAIQGNRPELVDDQPARVSGPVERVGKQP
jgi:hypothetical protein